MNDFARMMTEAGVQPLGAVAPSVRRPQAVQPAPAATPPLRKPPQAPAWAIGEEGLETLERAIRNLARNGILQRPKGQIIMLVRKDGALVDNGDPGNVNSARELIQIADQIDCEMMILAWDDRKAVFHPLSGAAVMAVDPSDRP